ncbi:hypothetical protein [Actinocrispum sp. NPDC049592]|uniref:hypothetical protein n=1 Tax=Actinocrispum sp. NPDC049592 TaxID=3154835 RepID=UPI003429A62A
MTDDPAALLGDLRQLRRKVRRDRSGCAFPLLLFGMLILAAPLCYETIRPEIGQVYERAAGPFPVFRYIWLPLKHEVLVQWYWMLALLAGFGATMWWYRRRAAQVGVETDLSGYLAAAGAGLVGVVFGVPVLAETVTVSNSLYSTPEVNLPIAFGSAAGSVVAFFLGTRRAHWRPVAVLAGTVLGMITLAAIGVYLVNGYSALLVIAVAMLVLAWVERSHLVAVTAALFTAASIHANLQGFAQLVPYTDDGRVMVLADLALPAGVLIIGGVIALLMSRRALA